MTSGVQPEEVQRVSVYDQSLPDVPETIYSKLKYLDCYHPPTSTIMWRRTMWITLAIIGGMLLIGFIALMTMGILSERAYQNMPDSHDLDARLEEAARKHVAGKPTARVVIGVYQKGKRYVKAFGTQQPPAANTPDGKLLFEIGSVTKLFTGITLAQQVRLGKVTLNDTIRQTLGKDIQLAKDLDSITLLQLATHTSGLPRLPVNLDSTIKNEADPYANYTAQDLIASLSSTELDAKPGTSSEYSNLGMGLLGHLLSERARRPYAELVMEGICQPLAMNDTTMSPNADQLQRLVPGHNEKNQPTSNWDFQVLAPTGGLRSTADDMLNFIEAQVKGTSEPLNTDLKLAMQKHYSSWAGDMGLAWHIMNPHTGLTIHWHNGGTGGYSSYLAVSKDHQTGVILMINNSEAETGKLDALGLEAIKWASKISLK